MQHCTNRIAACAAVFCLATIGDADAAALLREEARVLAADTGRLLYRETHWRAPGTSPTRWVLYRCADGKPFARKRVAGGTPASPDFSLEDGRDGYREGVRSASGKRAVFVREPGRAETSRTLAVPAGGVIDAGFDAAVRRHWPALMRGEAVRLQFLVPSRKRFYPVQVRRAGATEWNGIQAERLHMRLDAWYGFAVPDVALVYGRDDRRLLEFAGTGNVRDARGRNPQVRVVFDRAARTASQGELDSAIAAPLAARCDF